MNYARDPPQIRRELEIQFVTFSDDVLLRSNRKLIIAMK